MTTVERQLRKGNALNYKNPIKLDKTEKNIKRITLRDRCPIAKRQFIYYSDMHI